jgi:hypothetical protein
MTRTLMFKLVVISFILFGLLAVINALTEFDDEEERGYSDYEENLEGLSQFEDNVS